MMNFVNALLTLPLVPIALVGTLHNFHIRLTLGAFISMNQYSQFLKIISELNFLALAQGKEMMKIHCAT
jgi:hypothetical protein